MGLIDKKIGQPIQNATVIAGLALAVAIVALFIGMAAIKNG